MEAVTKGVAESVDPPDHWLVTLIDIDLLDRHGPLATGGESQQISEMIGLGMTAMAWVAIEKAVGRGRARSVREQATMQRDALTRRVIR
jgi:hypothetical protein